MDVRIFYFSGTGNTWWVSRKFAGKLEARGMSSQVHSIEQLDAGETAELIEDSEIVLFAYPIYGSYMPEPMKRFVDGLPRPSKTKKTGIFCTQMEASGDGAWFYHKAFEDKGYEILWTFHFKMPNNICIKAFPLPYTTDKGKLDRILNKCDVRISKAVDSVCSGTADLTGNGIGSLFLGLFQRPLYKRLVRRPFKSPYKVDTGICTKCMRCVQICPEGNITLTDGEITFGTDCTLCMRCYNFCPVSALAAYGFKPGDKEKAYRGPGGFDPALITRQKNLADYIK